METKETAEKLIETCSICYNQLISNDIDYYIIFQSCGHTICKECFKELIKTHNNCHICKSEILIYKISNSTEEIIYTKPDSVIKEKEEDFMLYTNIEFQSELKSCKERLLIIRREKFERRNSNPNTHENCLYSEIEEDIMNIEELILNNTSTNHFDKNKEILQNIQKVIDKLKKLSTGFTKEEINKLDKGNEDLFNIGIPVNFEKIKRKKK